MSKTDLRRSCEYIVLDGQQRLTAIYHSFCDPDRNLPGASSKIVFHISIDKFVENDIENAIGYTRITKNNEFLFENTEAQFEQSIFPVKVLSEKGLDVGLSGWVRLYRDYWKSKVEQSMVGETREIAQRNVEYAEKFYSVVSNIVSNYKVSFIELDQDIELEKVCDIFTQINSRGVPLNVFDLLNALMNPKKVKLKDWFRSARGKFEILRFQKDECVHFTSDVANLTEVLYPKTSL